MPEKFSPISFRLPDDLIEALHAEAKSETRNATLQIIHILRERYKNKPRLEDKQIRGSMRKS